MPKRRQPTKSKNKQSLFVCFKPLQLTRTAWVCRPRFHCSRIEPWKCDPIVEGPSVRPVHLRLYRHSRLFMPQSRSRLVSLLYIILPRVPPTIPEKHVLCITYMHRETLNLYIEVYARHLLYIINIMRAFAPVVCAWLSDCIYRVGMP